MEGPRKQFFKMDIVKALRELYNEKKRLDVTIAALEARAKAANPGSTAKASKRRRGRKSMSAAERLEVSKRMTSYWEARRAQLGTAPAPPTSGDQPEQSSTSSAS
jgi:hypothetical protein